MEFQTLSVKYLSINSGLLYLFINVFSCALLLCGSELGIPFSFATSFLLIRFVYKKFGVNSYLFIFVLGYFLYGYTAPISDVYDPDYNFYSVYDFNSIRFTLYNNIAGIAIFFSLLRGVPIVEKPIGREVKGLIFYAIFFGALASCGEVVNVIRAGGFGILGEGKAIYQESTGNLVLSFPSILTCNISMALAGLWLSKSNEKIDKVYLIAFMFSVLPVILLFLFIGRRGALMQIGLSFLIAASFYKVITNISFKIFLLGLSGAVFSALFFAVRGVVTYGIKEGDIGIITRYVTADERFLSTFLKGMNPAYSEFGAPLLNFTVFDRKYNAEWNTYVPLEQPGYIRDIINPIPTWLYPGVKPRSPSAVFRDTHFAYLAEKSRISGTAFSSILEAYSQMGGLGVFVFYYFFGTIIFWVERYRRAGGMSVWEAVLYVIMIGNAIKFHRSPLGLTYGLLVLNMVYVVIFGVVLKVVFGRVVFVEKLRLKFE